MTKECNKIETFCGDDFLRRKEESNKESTII